MTIQVSLISTTDNPIRSLYLAYRVAYSSLTPQQVLKQIELEKISSEKMEEFIEERLKTGHISPLEQCWFEFGISGTSRAMSHQFVRTRVGFSPEQQSQRYVFYKKGFDFTIPPTIQNSQFSHRFSEWMEGIDKFYREMVESGIPAEDARFILPNATNTNLKFTINFAALLHMCDLRLCTKAQWEYRRVVSLMRSEVYKKFPQLARHLQPKCGELRMGYCDESLEDWQKCPIGKHRPHKTVLFDTYNAVVGTSYPIFHGNMKAIPLDESDFQEIER